MNPWQHKRKRILNTRQLLALEVWAEVLLQPDTQVALDYKHGEVAFTITNGDSEIAWPLEP